ncbi:MAG: hypothetical protein J6R01_00030 [Alistipes sp.]|nr:hypothetical protein [Alistipes sp.]
MKHIWLIICSALSLALFTGCKGDEPITPTGSPELSLEKTSLDVTADGGHFVVGYELLNPADGAELTFNVQHDWVRNVAVEDGGISFDVDASYEAKERSCRIEVIYPGVYPNPTIKIKQSAGKKHSIEFNLINAAATTITLDVIPQDKNMPYVFILGNGDYIMSGDLMTNDEALWASDIEIFEGFGNAFGSDATVAAKAFMYQGDLKSHQFTGVTPNTTYVAYAYGFDNETLTPLTEISRLVIKTAEVSDYTLHFDFDVKVDGPNVSFDITPEGYDGYYYYGVFWASDVPEGTDPEVIRELCEADWEQQKAIYSSFFDTPDQGLNFIFNELAYKGTTHLDVELDANTEFVLWAFGMDGEALLNTTPETYYFTTGNVAASANEFTLSVEELYSRKATVKVATTNDDSYIATLVSASRFENNSDEEIIEYIVNNFKLQYASGTMQDTATGLTPNTEYELLVFGCQAGAPTTKLNRLKFTTLDTVYADLDFELEIGDYYDGSAVAAINPDYAAFEGTVIVGITANVDSEAVEFYYTAMNALDFPYYTYEQLIEGLVAEGAAEANGLYAFEFGEPYIFFGVAEDGDGNYTKVWSSKEITFTKAGCSPAEEFFAAESTSATISKRTAKSANHTMLSIE